MEIVLLVERILFLAGVAICGMIIGRILRLDTSLACVLAGLLAGMSLPLWGFDTGVRAHNLQHLVFYVILPILIFEAAWHIKPAMLRDWLRPTLILAVPGVILAAFAGAGLLYLAIGHASGFPFVAALLAATILAATDPSALIARMRQLDAPKGLTTIMDSESLFNDATTVVLFSLVLAFSMGQMADPGWGLVREFSAVFFGGALFGAIAGLISAIIVLALGNRAGSSIVLVFTALASFFVAEHLLHISGIMAVTFSAIICRYLLHEQEEGLLAGAADTWEWLGALFNALLFTLMGLVITFDMFREQYLAMLIAIIVTLLTRGLTVSASAGFSRLLRRPIPGRWQVVMTWGGLRGAVAVALVLALPASLPYWYTIQSMVFAVVLFSLLVQGTTTAKLVQRLQLK